MAHTKRKAWALTQAFTSDGQQEIEVWGSKTFDAAAEKLIDLIARYTAERRPILRIDSNVRTETEHFPSLRTRTTYYAELVVTYADT